MVSRLVALDDGPDIILDRAMLVVGRHPQCDARLDSIRVSRRHCCMTPDNGELLVRDLGSTNGIRINGQRVEAGRLRAGDELSIAHFRYRLDNGQGQEMTLAEAADGLVPADGHAIPFRARPFPGAPGGENPLAAAVRDLLPSGVADRCRIQVIVQMQPDGEPAAAAVEAPDLCRHDSSP